MDEARYKKLENIITDLMINGAFTLACDLWENGVTFSEWHDMTILTSGMGGKSIHPFMNSIPNHYPLTIGNYLRDFERNRDKPKAKYRMRKADKNYPF
jgi:hypothetical protein